MILLSLFDSQVQNMTQSRKHYLCQTYDKKDFKDRKHLGMDDFLSR